MARAHVAVLLASSALFGCSATAGSTWLREPESGPFANQDLAFPDADEHLAVTREARTSSFVEEPEADPTPDSRARLTRTVTLGEITTAADTRSDAPAGAAAAPVSVTVNNYVTAPQPSYYDGYVSPYFYGGYRPGSGAPVRPSHPIQPSATRPGQNWPAIPSHGTAFPFKTAPASPWSPAR
jgi:hypothetical protein